MIFQYFPGAFRYGELKDETDGFIDYWFRAACEQVAKEKHKMINQAQMNIKKEVEETNILYQMLHEKNMKFLERNLLRGE